MSTGTVQQLWRYPVKSMAGERLAAALVDRRGAGGDRTHAVMHEHKGAMKPLTAREAPRLLAWHAEYGGEVDPARPPLCAVIAPDGRRYAWGEEGLREHLEEDLRRRVGLRRDVAGIQDLPETLLLTTQATLEALDGELPRRLDLRRFRTNVHLDLDAPAWAESGWEGGTVTFEGGVVLELLHPCVRCAIPTRDPDTQEKWPQLLKHLDARHDTLFGINARVRRAGRIEAGEGVNVQARA